MIEAFTLLYLKQYDGKVCLLNYDGFYDPLIALLKHYVDAKMMTDETLDKLIIANTAEELLSKL